MMNILLNISGRKKQKGATLVVALIILLVMTIIGISSMKSSTLQERMAGNARQKAIAKNAAVTALREAEVWLAINVQKPEDIDLEFTGAASNKYAAVRRPVGSALPLASSVDVTNPESWASVGSVAETELNLAQQPKYIIEYVGRDIRGSASSKVRMLDIESRNSSDLSPYFFRITAIGWGKDKNIYTVLESTYKTGYGDGAFVY